MNGWKTWVAFALLALPGLGSICTGSAGILAHWVDPSSNVAMNPDAAMLMIQGGFGAIGMAFATIGIGHKIEKAAADNGTVLESIADRNPPR